MQTKFVEIRPLLSGIFQEKSLNFRRMFCEVRSRKIHDISRKIQDSEIRSSKFSR